MENTTSEQPQEVELVVLERYSDNDFGGQLSKVELVAMEL
jgi:hypothetical protein